MYLYFRTAGVRRLPIVVFGLAMLGIHAYTFFGSPPPSDGAAAVTALTAYVVFALVIWFLESRPDAHSRGGAPRSGA